MVLILFMKYFKISTDQLSVGPYLSSDSYNIYLAKCVHCKITVLLAY